MYATLVATPSGANASLGDLVCVEVPANSANCTVHHDDAQALALMRAAATTLARLHAKRGASVPTDDAEYEQALLDIRAASLRLGDA